MRKEVSISELRQCLEYCEEKGGLTWIQSKNGRCTKPGMAGTLHHRYKVLYLDKNKLKVHRVVWAIVKGEWPNGVIDHINGITTDNRIENLRDVDHRTNIENQKKARKDNKIGLLGVIKAGSDGYRARIRTFGKCIYGVKRMNPHEAHDDYLKIKKVVHKGCV